MYYKLFIEAFVIGILTLVVGSLVSLFFGSVFTNDLPTLCKDWNKFHVMEISLFLTGFTLHLLCEAVGINKMYCRNSFACSKVKTYKANNT